jgi:hypothetical protein
MKRQEIYSVNLQKHVKLLWRFQLQLTNAHVLKILHKLLFLRGVNKSFQFVKELLVLLHMKEETGADQIFCQIVTFINKFDLRLGE